MSAREREMQQYAKAQATAAGSKARLDGESERKRDLARILVKIKQTKQQHRLMADAVKASIASGFEWRALSDAVGQLTRSVGNADSRVRAAEQHAESERMRCERLQDQVQSIKGNIRVFARVRRLPHTSFVFDGSCSYPEEDSLSITDADAPGGGKAAGRKSFTFDRVFKQDATQQHVYRDVRPLVLSALEGYNACILAYGQTGSGKTHTMQGPESDPGVTLRTLRDLFQQSSRDPAVECSFSLSVLEVYNERSLDLLVDPRTAEARRVSKHDLPVRVDVVRGVMVEGLTELGVEDEQSALDIIALAQSNRVVGVTHANDHSSRSHLIVTVYITTTVRSTGKTHYGKLHLVDLAGSERQAKALTQGAADVESKHINRSLSSLQDVFAALLAKEKHIPFRNSKLTQLLQDSLAGNSKVLMVVTVSSRVEDARESVASLALARRVRSIVLGGARRAVENEEYTRIQKDHQTSLHERDDRIKLLQQQLVTALGAARAGQVDKTRRAASVAGRKAEERKASDVDRAAIERRCADAENDA
eukprot:CAMPEP_0180189786 /NCGR_PEP_ID=MMETSP0987-20121128/531_1 /TAXON_ID=697907 /ORGANISM="non described non described, Strain CCMP2293" /LENGTH=534 /DNA_ID=CAMNT_0022144167 /DNA_START=15 /DNA_END=1615 /DNA_ORIENTATION=+